MKSILLSVAALVFLLTPLAAQIKVASPNGNETLTLGTQWPIAWTAVNVSEDVRIVLLRANGTKFGVIKEPLAPGASPWGWNVGETDNGLAPAGQYRVRVITLSGLKHDVSDALFTIAAGTTPPPPPPPPGGPASLTVTSPNGGESWTPGSSRTITWNAANFSGDVDLILKQNGNIIGTIARKLSATQGSHPWAVGALLEGNAANPGGGFTVRVVKNYEGLFRHKGMTELADESDNAFSIKDIWSAPIPEAMRLNVIAPTDGNEFVYNSFLVDGVRGVKVTCRWIDESTGPFEFFLHEVGNKTETPLQPLNAPAFVGNQTYEAVFHLTTKITSPDRWYKIHVKKGSIMGGHSGKFKLKYKLHVVTLEPNIHDGYHWENKQYDYQGPWKYNEYALKTFPSKAGNARVGFHNSYFTWNSGIYNYNGTLFRSRIRFDFSQFEKLQGDIVDAKLIVKQNWFYHASAMDLRDCDVGFYVLEANWSGGSDFFSTYGDHLLYNFVSGTASDFYLTNWADAWCKGTSPNHGLLLVPAKESMNHDNLYGVSYYQFWLKVAFQEK